MNERFIDAVKESGLSQYQISKGSGVPFSTINGFMLQTHDINKCAAASLYSIATFLNKPISSLLNPSPQMINIHGVYNGIRYQWKKDPDESMSVVFKYNKEDVKLPVGYKCNIPEQKDVYPLVAEMLIDMFLYDKMVEKKISEV